MPDSFPKNAQNRAYITKFAHFQKGRLSGQKISNMFACCPLKHMLSDPSNQQAVMDLLEIPFGFPQRHTQLPLGLQPDAMLL